MDQQPRGLSFPLRFGPLGHLERTYGVNKLKNNIYAIVTTALGERFARPSMGTTAFASVFRNMTEPMLALLQNSVATAVGTYEPRVNVAAVQMTPDYDEGQVIVKVIFEVKGSGVFESLVVPVGA